MRKMYCVAAFLLLMAVLCSCAAQMPEEEIPVGADTGLVRTGVVYGTDGHYLVPVEAPAELGNGCAEQMLRNLQSVSAEGLSPVIPESVRLSVSAQGSTAVVELSGETSELNAEQTVASIVNTLTQFGGIEQVSLRVNGVSDRFGSVDISQPIREVSLNPAYDLGELQPFQVFFQNEGGLVVPVTKATGEPSAEVFVNAMMTVPKGAEGLSALFPAGTRLNSAAMSEGTLMLDFSGELYGAAALPEAEEKLLTAIGTTCRQLEGVREIVLSVDGTEYKRI